MPENTFAQAVGARLRAIRIQRGLSLEGLERKSGGRWKTAAVGSYERGDRMISVWRLAELAGFYGVPVGAFLPGPRESDGRLRLDVEAVRAAPPAAEPLRRWVASIQHTRGDWGRVVTLRRGDLRALTAVYAGTPDGSAVLALLQGWGVLAAPPAGILDARPEVA